MRLLIEENGQVIADNVRTAGSFMARLKGLLGEADFPSGSGLHIIPCRSVHTFFMRFSIDVIYLDERNRIVGMEADMKPGRIGNVYKRALSVVELPNGTLYRSKPQLGQTVSFQE